MSFGGGDTPEVEESKYDQELARIRDAEWAKYKERFPEHDRRMIAEARAFDTGARREKARGVAAATLQQRRPTVSAGAGVDPSGGQFMAAVGRDTVTRGGGVGAAMAETDLQSTGGYLSRMMGAVKLGKDIENQGVQGYTRLANAELSREVSDAYSSARESAATGEAVGTAVGFGLQRWRSGGDAPTAQLPERSMVNSTDPGVMAYHRSGGYRGSGF
jgi:hypothetical protein